MGQDTSNIREEIDQTRAEMGDTVDALAHKTDVKSRVRESFSDKKERLRTQMAGTGSRISEATPDGQEVKEGARQVVGIAEENPIGLALGGLPPASSPGCSCPARRSRTSASGRWRTS